MAQLRSRLANKSDDEIIQVLRGYVSSDRRGDGDGMTWVAKRLGRAKEQREAVEAVKTLHGGVFYDYQKGSSICRPEGEPRTPAWLRRILSDHFFVDVVGVGLSGEHIANEALARLRPFPNLEFVILGCPQVDNSGLAHLVGFSNLRYLEIRRTRVTEDAIEELAKALPENCAIDWNGKWVRPPKHKRTRDSAGFPRCYVPD